MKTREKKRIDWEIIDRHEAHMFWAETEQGRDDLEAAAKLLGHDVIVREVWA